MKERLDSHQFEGWKAWFGWNSPGGVRSPTDEVNDVLLSRLAAVLLNVYKPLNSPTHSVRSVMLYPPPITQEEYEARVLHAKASLRGYLGSLKKRAK